MSSLNQSIKRTIINEIFNTEDQRDKAEIVRLVIAKCDKEIRSSGANPVQVYDFIAKAATIIKEV